MIPNKQMLSKVTIKPLVETLKITDIDDSVYFGKEYADYISNSRMGLINPMQGGCPKDFFEGLSKHNKFSTSLAFGSAVHELSLQPDTFFLCEDVKAPSAKVGMMADLLWGYASKTGELPDDEKIRDAASTVDYYHGFLTANQLNKVKAAIKPYFKERFKFEQSSTDTRKPIYLDTNSLDRLQNVMSSIEANKAIQKLLHPKDILDNELPSYNETTILLDIEINLPDVEPFIMKLKAKLDNYTIDQLNNAIVINDVKTTGKPLDGFNYAVKNFHYYREIAFYTWLLQLGAAKYGLENPSVSGNFLVVETTDKFNSSVVSMKKHWYKAGVVEFIWLLKLIAWYKAYGYE